MVEHQYIFFLAHAGGDTEKAKVLRNLLHPDIPVFLDAFDLKLGDQWDIELPRHQKLALATVALLSSSTESAYYLREEIANAIAYQRNDPDTHRLIPVYLDGFPKDPSDVVYGVRVRHALDAAKMGMDGVAAELKKFVPDLESASPALLPDNMPKPADRFELFDALCRLLPTMFDEILFRVAAPVQHLAPAGQPLARRALDLVQWAEGISKMNELTQAIHKVAPGVFGPGR